MSIELHSNNPVEECHVRSARVGFRVFGVESENECYSSADAGSSYTKHGRGTGCRDGVGGDWRMDVYQITECKCYSPGHVVWNLMDHVEFPIESGSVEFDVKCPKRHANTGSRTVRCNNGHLVAYPSPNCVKLGLLSLKTALKRSCVDLSIVT